MNANEFLQTLWGEQPAGKVLIWTLPDKHSYWYTSFETVTQDFQDHKGKDVYTGMALMPHATKTTSNRRVKLTDEIAGIPGVWVDIDIADPVHKKKNLPPTEDDALAILRRMPNLPTIVVKSGHGLQALWLFEEPWLFEGPEDQQMAANVCHWWHRKASSLANEHGWTIDSVFDLTRIMRLPGFTNNKGPVPKEVTVALPDGPRLDLQATIRAAINDPPDIVQPPKGRPRTPENQSHTYGFNISADAEPPSIKLSATIENMPRFKDTWEGTRRDLNDTSPSGYDMSLASMAAQANWTDQEIVNLLIAFRRKHGHDLKLRHGYFATTLEKARSTWSRAQTERNLTEAIKQINPFHEEGNSSTQPKPENGGRAQTANGNGNGNGKSNGLQSPTDDNNNRDPREVLKDTLAKSLGFRINRMLKYTGDPSVYWMHTDQGDIRIGKISNITNAQNFRNIVAEITGLIIPRFNGQAWDIRAQALLKLCEPVDVGDASVPEQQMREWLERYLASRNVTDEDGMAAAISQRTPFQHDGRIHILLDDLRSWIKIRAGTDLSSHEVASRLHQAGAESKQVNIMIDGKRTSRHCWRIPQ